MIKLGIKELVECFESIINCNKYVGDYSYRDLDTGIQNNRFDNLLVDITVSGASGGNCWGDYAQQFRESDEEKTSNIASEIVSALGCLNLSRQDSDEISRALAENAVNSCSSVSSYSNNEYYGNYYDKEVFAISFKDLFEQLTTKGLIANGLQLEDLKTALQPKVKNQKLESDIALADKRKKELAQDVANFEKRQAHKKQNLEREIAALKANLPKLEKQLASFDATSEKEKKALQKSLDAVSKELEELRAQQK